MQYAMIVTGVTSFTSDNGGQTLRLTVSDYKGRSIALLGTPNQQINILTLKSQVMPILVLSDHVDTVVATGQYLIPEKSLVSVVPLESSAIQVMLDVGKADQILSSFAVLP